MDEFEIEMKQEFLEEVDEMLEEVEECFLELETSVSNPDSLKEVFNDTLDKVFRLAHNIKGTAAAVGFEGLSSFTHSVESFLLKIKVC